MSDPAFFETPDAFRRWLAKNHATKTELRVGFYKTKTGTKSITWSESVDEALCYGWIDGVRKGISADAYEIRFTPRKATSIWSNVNVKKVAALEAEGRMQPAGRAAFARRLESKTGIYGHDRATEAVLPAAWQKEFEAKKKAWAWFAACPPGYRKIAIHVVMSAKKEETRRRRFESLLVCSSEGRKLDQLAR